MYYVYYGYVSPDNYDSSNGPTYEIKEIESKAGVIEFKKEFDEEMHDECANIIFRVFKGRECHLEPIEVVKDYKLV